MVIKKTMGVDLQKVFDSILREEVRRCMEEGYGVKGRLKRAVKC